MPGVPDADGKPNVPDPKMPPPPKSWDPVSLVSYFKELETTDPKGANLCHEVSDYVDDLAETTLGAQGMSTNEMFDPADMAKMMDPADMMFRWD